MKLLQECEAILTEAKSTMRMNGIARVARLLRDAGMELSYANIADYANLNEDDVDKLFKWNLSDKKHKKLDFDVGSTTEAKGDYAKVLAGILWITTHHRRGVDLIADKAGLPTDRVIQLIAAHKRDIYKEFPEFSNLWLFRNEK